jgi:uncharacterized membrane protein YgcG
MPRIPRLAPLAFLALAACAANDGPSPRGGHGPDSEFSGAQGNSSRGAGGSFNMAARLVDQGQFQQALPALRCYASQGPGWEIAQYLAGYSALNLSTAAETPEILRDELRVEGFDLLIVAGDAGWPAAQAELASWFATSGYETGLIEAAYWAAVYRRNTRDRAYGLDRLDNRIEAEITTALSEDQSNEAERRAGQFIVVPMQRVETGPECAPFLRSAMMSPGRSRGNSEERRRPQGGGRGGGGSRGGGRGGGGPY